MLLAVLVASFVSIFHTLLAPLGGAAERPFGRPGPHPGARHEVYAIDVSPDGRYVAAGGARIDGARHEGEVEVWDLRTNELKYALRLLHRPDDRNYGVQAVGFSPDGRWLVTGSIKPQGHMAANAVELWDAQNGQYLRTLPARLGTICALAFSPNSRTLAVGCYNDAVVLWDVAGDAPPRTVTRSVEEVTTVAWSDDGRTMATASADGSIKLWDPKTAVLRRTLARPGEMVSALAFSPDSRYLAAGTASPEEVPVEIRVWDLQKKDRVRTLNGHLRAVTALAFSPNGKLLASGGDDRTVRVWDARSGTPRQVLRGHQRAVTDVAWGREGREARESRRLLSASVDGTVRIWNLDAGRPVTTLSVRSEDAGPMPPSAAGPARSPERRPPFEPRAHTFQQRR